MIWTIIFAALFFGAAAVLSSRVPLSLTGVAKKRFLAAAAILAAVSPAALYVGGNSAGQMACGTFLVLGMLLMSTTDLLERHVYDLHFYALTAVGILSAILRGTGFPVHILAFLLLLGVMFLISRRNPGLGMGDGRMIACLALYFTASAWMEVILLALACALIYGVWGMLRKRSTLKTELPFAPFLLAAIMMEFLFRI